MYPTQRSPATEGSQTPGSVGIPSPAEILRDKEMTALEDKHEELLLRAAQLGQQNNTLRQLLRLVFYQWQYSTSQHRRAEEMRRIQLDATEWAARVVHTCATQWLKRRVFLSWKTFTRTCREIKRNIAASKRRRNHKLIQICWVNWRTITAQNVSAGALAMARCLRTLWACQAKRAAYVHTTEACLASPALDPRLESVESFHVRDRCSHVAIASGAGRARAPEYRTALLALAVLVLLILQLEAVSAQRLESSKLDGAQRASTAPSRRLRPACKRSHSHENEAPVLDSDACHQRPRLRGQDDFGAATLGLPALETAVRGAGHPGGRRGPAGAAPRAAPRHVVPASAGSVH
ncbi:hypothetical protein ON010_g11850 [Phytophthora cinnamomi]|nr:hypothetical protein ON010_g11850 [Phytophthora cinnamomi]